MGMFDDMMSSGRGPGVIGTLMALLVIIGFGSLYFFVFDEGMRGGDRSIESVIRDNGKDIESLTMQVESRKKSLEGAPALMRIASEAEGIASQTRMGKGNLEGQIKTIAEAKKELAAKDKEFADYKQAYRQQLRAKGKGMTYPELIVGTETYKKASITGVDAAGITFMYEGGSTRIDFGKLPQAIREHFQYDPAEAAWIKDKEEADRNVHANETEADRKERERLAKEAAAKQREETKRKATADLATQQGLLQDYDQKISSAERARDRDRQSKFFDRAKHDRILSGLRTGKEEAQRLANSAKEALKKASE